eukprot:Gregarina_sp_Poly_1__10373@NODE_741_length_6490_cov_91_583528_g552_i0_p1_GENE_NODE_741_length_6490_cov_91_583528_g552_i0NODE_741_length_6490_cov_91_583528_g552_i0_p1_ORF_typecomplete_len1089_score188_35CwfJ_C_1/PF04677_15/4_5e31CwfJ_C_2/PF04676_14/6_9e03CwfJ_C_2/PF04676_14/2_7e09RRM_1/PF00076_22/1_3e05Nup35_RRM/PF05172_13/0_077_NODE_741_length_6490_cov_91_583528_g552_i031996465
MLPSAIAGGPSPAAEGEKTNGVRVLLWGDVQGNFASFAEHLQRAVERYGAFDLCICVGSFFGDLAVLGSATDDAMKLLTRVSEILPARLPVPRVVILDSSPAESLGAALRASFPSGVGTLQASPVGTSFQLLGTRGVATIAGLQVAFLSCGDTGAASLPREGDGDGDDVNMDILLDDGVTDLCLLTNWPAEIVHGLGLNEEEQRSLSSSLAAEDVTLPPLPFPSGDASVGVSSNVHKAFLTGTGLARYIVAAGGPSIFYQRPAFEAFPGGQVFTRFIGLASMPPKNRGSMDAAPPPVSSVSTRKFTHSLKLVPFALKCGPSRKRPASVSQNPFLVPLPGGQPIKEETASEDGEDWPWQQKPAKRRRKTEEERREDAPRLPQNHPPPERISKNFGGDAASDVDTAVPSWVPNDPEFAEPAREDSCPPTGSAAAVSDESGQKDSAAIPETAASVGRIAKSRWGGGEEESNDVSSSPVTGRVVYLLNVPFSAAKWQIINRMSDFGTVLDARFPRGAPARGNAGRAWVTYASSEGAAKAVKHGEIYFMNRVMKAMFALNQDTQKIGNGNGSEQRQNATVPTGSEESFKMVGSSRASISGPSVDTRPQSDCWFCLCNPNSEKKLIIFIGHQAYITISKGGLVPQHLMILPVSHQPNMSICPGSIQEEVRSLMDCLRGYFYSQGLAVVFFERYVPMKLARVLHTQVHAVPLPRYLISECHKILSSKSRAEALRMTPLKGLPFANVQEVLLKQYSQIFDVPRSPGNPEDSTLNFPYWWIDLPDDDSGGKSPSSHHSEKRVTWLGLTSSSFQRLNLNFAREVLATVLSAPERILWKNCITSRMEEEQWAGHVRSSFDAYKQLIPPPPNPEEDDDDSGDDEAQHRGPDSSDSSASSQIQMYISAETRPIEARAAEVPENNQSFGTSAERRWHKRPARTREWTDINQVSDEAPPHEWRSSPSGSIRRPIATEPRASSIKAGYGAEDVGHSARSQNCCAVSSSTLSVVSTNFDAKSNCVRKREVSRSTSSESPKNGISNETSADKVLAAEYNRNTSTFLTTRAIHSPSATTAEAIHPNRISPVVATSSLDQVVPATAGK